MERAKREIKLIKSPTMCSPNSEQVCGQGGHAAPIRVGDGGRRFRDWAKVRNQTLANLPAWVTA
jgi:hypothetical protein